MSSSPWRRTTQAWVTCATSIVKDGCCRDIHDLLRPRRRFQEVKRRCSIRGLGGSGPGADALQDPDYRTPVQGLSRVVGLPAGCASLVGGAQLVLFDEVRGAQHEHLANHVGILLVSTHEPDYRAPGRVLNDRLEALSH